MTHVMHPIVPMKRTTRQTCMACGGRGYHLVRHFDDFYSEEWTTREPCSRCAGRGHSIMEHPDLIKCVCKKTFPTIAALAEHRKGCP